MTRPWPFILCIYASSHPITLPHWRFGNTSSGASSSGPSVRYGSIADEVAQLRYRASLRAAISQAKTPKTHTGKDYTSKTKAKKGAKGAAGRSGGKGRFRKPCKAGNHYHCDYYPDVKTARRGRKKDRISTGHHYW